MQLDARLTESVLMFLLTLVQAVREAEAVSCFEGACADDLTQCSECEGSGCVRATRLESRDTFRSVTLTCLPQEREFVAEPEGCRRHTNSDGRICICYSDWCNSAPTVRAPSFTHIVYSIIIVLSVFFFVKPSLVSG